MRAFIGSFLLPYHLGLSPCFVETWVWRRGENFSMTEINTVPSYGSIPFPFCFSLSIVIPSCPLLHNTAPLCLHIARSNATNCSFTACSFDAFSSHHPIPKFNYVLFLPSLVVRWWSLVEYTKIKCSSKHWRGINHFIVGREAVFSSPITAKLVALLVWFNFFCCLECHVLGLLTFACCH